MTDESIIPETANKHCDGCRFWKKDKDSSKKKRQGNFQRCKCKNSPHFDMLTEAGVFCGKWSAIEEVQDVV